MSQSETEGEDAASDRKRVGLWIRTSGDAKSEADGQLRSEAVGYAQSRGWILYKEYLALASTANSLAKGEANEMLGDIESGSISGLIVSHLGSLAGDGRSLLEIAHCLQARGANLISLRERIDTSLADRSVIYAVIVAMADLDSSRKRSSIAARARLGRSVGGAAPFGYQTVGYHLVLDEKEAPVRRLAFDLFLVHKRLKTVARKLNEKGCRTRNGSKFSDTTVRRHLQDPIAKGQRRTNYTRSTGVGKRLSLKPLEEWTYYDVPALVSTEIWEAVNALLADLRDPIVREIN